MVNNLKEMQEIQFEILKEVKKVCEKNDIKFYLAYGTCLGAVRHNGFIPWDDDIDIFMNIEDFERFTKLSYEFESQYFLQTNKTDKNYGLSIARVRKNNTTLIEQDEKENDIHHGVFIDIYPLYNCPNTTISSKLQIINSYLYRILLLGRPPMNNGKIIKNISKFLLSICKGKIRAKALEFLYKQMTKYNDTKYVTSLYGLDVSTKYEKEWFDTPFYLDFEGEKMPVPQNYNQYLNFRYGDYMELPPVEKRVIHHMFHYVDLNNSYEKYKGIHYLTKGR